MLYENCQVSSLKAFRDFYRRLHSSDQKWDSLRRIQFSTPGRWVRSLDLRKLKANNRSDIYAVDDILTNLFPILPFLEKIQLNPSIPMSKRSMGSLSSSEATRYLKSLRGVKYDATFLEPQGQHLDQDPLTQTVASCHKLEELEVKLASCGLFMTSTPYSI